MAGTRKDRTGQASAAGGALVPPYSRCPGVRRQLGSAQGQEEAGGAWDKQESGEVDVPIPVCVHFAEPAWKIMSVYMRYTSVCEHLANICITAAG